MPRAYEIPSFFSKNEITAASTAASRLTWSRGRSRDAGSVGSVDAGVVPETRAGEVEDGGEPLRVFGVFVLRL